MVSDAVAAYRGDAPTEKTDVRMDLQVDAHIPEGYVRGERLRLEVYAKIAATSTPEQEADVREELVDRYGPIPPQVDLLFAVARLREIVRRAGIAEVVTQGKYLRVSPVELRDSQVMRLKRLHPGTVIKTAVRQVLVPLPPHHAHRRIPADGRASVGVGGDASDQDSRTFWRVVPVVEYTGPIALQDI